MEHSFSVTVLHILVFKLAALFPDIEPNSFLAAFGFCFVFFLFFLTFLCIPELPVWGVNPPESTARADEEARGETSDLRPSREVCDVTPALASCFLVFPRVAACLACHAYILLFFFPSSPACQMERRWWVLLWKAFTWPAFLVVVVLLSHQGSRKGSSLD